MREGCPKPWAERTPAVTVTRSSRFHVCQFISLRAEVRLLVHRWRAKTRQPSNSMVSWKPHVADSFLSLIFVAPPPTSPTSPTPCSPTSTGPLCLPPEAGGCRSTSGRGRLPRRGGGRKAEEEEADAHEWSDIV